MVSSPATPHAGRGGRSRSPRAVGPRAGYSSPHPPRTVARGAVGAGSVVRRGDRDPRAKLQAPGLEFGRPIVTAGRPVRTRSARAPERKRRKRSAMAARGEPLPVSETGETESAMRKGKGQEAQESRAELRRVDGSVHASEKEESDVDEDRMSQLPRTVQSTAEADAEAARERQLADTRFGTSGNSKHFHEMTPMRLAGHLIETLASSMFLSAEQARELLAAGSETTIEMLAQELAVSTSAVQQAAVLIARVHHERPGVPGPHGRIAGDVPGVILRPPDAEGIIQNIVPVVEA